MINAMAIVGLSLDWLSLPKGQYFKQTKWVSALKAYPKTRFTQPAAVLEVGLMRSKPFYPIVKKLPFLLPTCSGLTKKYHPYALNRLRAPQKMLPKWVMLFTLNPTMKDGPSSKTRN